MDRMILSIASSLRLSRDKNKAFLEKRNQTCIEMARGVDGRELTEKEAKDPWHS